MSSTASAVRPTAAVARRRENFPVASRLLPSRYRRHLLAVYDFARLVDDVGDEAAGDRLAQLAWLDADVDRAFEGRAEHSVLVRLQTTIRDRALEPDPFHRLVEANRRDQRVARYPTWEALREYCSYSADPVGRLVLDVFGVSTPARVAWSDDVCTALQLTEHLQDVAEDRARGRVYLPEEDLARFGCSDTDLDGSSATPRLRRVIAYEVTRARSLLQAGTSLVASLRGFARLAVVGFVAGGRAALDAIEGVDDDVLRHRAPGPSRRSIAANAWTVHRTARRASARLRRDEAITR
ncbi:MAG: squalene synthase HpnC [Actinobacteria bacterium]|nr:MAG: squalene synthase HpnC [Actinomycetota bacterium]